MKFTEYASLDGTGLAELIRCGEVSPDEVIATATQAITAMNTTLNAVVEGPWEVPPTRPTRGPFGGVPFVLKDILCHSAGVPMRMGSRALAKGLTFDHDTDLMARFIDAGLTCIASTTTPELALSSATVSKLTGITANPWRAGVTPGGSSGGSAVLVASGAVPLAHANDGGGSIRIPAARNGLVGLKPSRARTPIGPGQQEVMSGNAVEFAVTRSVRDTARLLDAVHGYAVGDRYAALPPARPYVDELVGPTRRFRIAMSTRAWSDVPVDKEVIESVEGTARTLSDAGHLVEQGAPPIDWDQLTHAFNTIWCFGTSATVCSLAAVGQVPIDADHFEVSTLVSYEHGLRLGPVELAAAFDAMNTISRSVAKWMLDYDVFLAPTSNTASRAVDYLESQGEPNTSIEWVRRVLGDNPICPLYNVTGAPAISLPVAATSHGLPLGLHFGAPMYGEGDLIALAAQLEQARPWQHRRPEIHVSSVNGAQC